LFREVLGLNLARIIGYPEWGLSWFSSVPRDSTLFKPRAPSFTPFPICRILGSHKGGYEELYRLGYNAM
jgi:hypothetical protein